MNGILKDTLAELISRKMLFLFGFVTLVILLGIWLTGEIGDDISIRTGEDFEVEDMLGSLRPWIAGVFSQLMTIFVFLAVLATVSLIPASLEKGRAEYYLSKPLSRTRFLVSRLFSVWLVYGSVVMFCGLITYGFTSAIHGIFDAEFFYLFFVYWLDFLIWLSVIALAGILFGSTAGAMVTVFLVWIGQTVLTYHEEINQLVSSKPVHYVVNVLYYALPKTGEIGDIAVSLAVGSPVISWMPLWSSLLFASAMFYLANWVFKRRDY